MTSSMNTILVIGGTSGIGQAFVQRFHKMGKKLIVTGRRQARLDELKSSLSGLETYAMDNTDLASLPKHVETLTRQYSDIDTVWVNGGIQTAFSIKDPNSSTDKSVINEIDTNVTAPVVLARHFIPFLLSTGSEANFMITTSGLAFIPIPSYPVYCATKAFVHHFLVGMRQSLAGTNVNVIEIAPPRVETELDTAHKAVSNSGPPSISVQDFTDKTFEILDNGKASELKEVAVGFAQNGVSAWRGGIGKVLEGMKIGG
ncbi:hypothetical protein LTR05_008614 [Lithohypha guttulata]|uniref:Uncharacterized protein n=1 Tax=Lithohypha guttulata TaxID=1690604 RepID=A0AAN7SRW2_9EURO|nr:hypothetical protein LTR05_008614 [Lithohypha guttulata]